MKFAKILQHIALAILVMLGLGSTVLAASNAQVPPATLPAYAAASALPVGTVVAETSKAPATVAVATSKAASKMYGVVVDPHQLTLTVQDSSVPNQTFVATSGTYNTLVSSQAGVIKKGDYVTLSALDGMVMKAVVSDKLVFGRAEANFDGKTNTIGTVTLKDTNGKTDKAVALGLIPVAINIQKNPMQISTKANLPKQLQKLGQEVAQHQVSEVRIYISIAVTGLSIVVALVTLYAGIRSAVISIGRNPLSKKTIYRGLASIILTSFLILIVGLFAVYLLLKL